MNKGYAQGFKLFSTPYHSAATLFLMKNGLCIIPPQAREHMKRWNIISYIPDSGSRYTTGMTNVVQGACMQRTKDPGTQRPGDFIYKLAVA